MFISENCDSFILQKMAKRDEGLAGNATIYGSATTPVIDSSVPSMPQ